MNYRTTADLAFIEEEFELLESAIQEVNSSSTRTHKDYIFIPDNYEYFKVQLNDILFIEADGSYVKVCTRNKSYQISTNLKSFSQQFRHPDFIRVSRKHIINIRFTERINGVYLVLRDCSGTEYKIAFSKRKRQEILGALPIIKIRH